ncbi:MAG: NAD(P)H-dependent oxidoreductase subunit E [Planctomycetes bacterium]|nr:NAD(P)H-dependent oxidoreductase subunit E [Planctomycetota bacterium]
MEQLAEKQTPAGKIDLGDIDRIIERIGRTSDKCIPILQAIQEQYRYLPAEALERVCTTTEITPARIAGVSTFYDYFRHSPVGKHIIRVCHGTACHVKGAGMVYDALLRLLKIPDGQDSDPDGEFTITKVACLGCCTLAPAVQIEDVTYGHMTAHTVDGMINDYRRLHRQGRPTGREPAPGAAGGQGQIKLGLGSCCQARGSARVRQAVIETLGAIGSRAEVKSVGCVGMCHQTPLLEVNGPSGQALYARVQAEDVPAIIRRHFRPVRLADRIKSSASVALDALLTGRVAGTIEHYSLNARDSHVLAFLAPQKHVVTEHCGQIDPLNLDEYLAGGGFEALKKCLNEMTPETIIEQVTASGLRGRGGAGFPTGRKWQAVRQAPGAVKYVISNGDEGDPGAFMDRMIMESYPFRLIEGLAIAAWAVGAGEGVFYIRAEYPLAVVRMQAAMDACVQRGLIGRGALGGKLNLTARIMQGAGAFICGEETALMASVEGRRGMPRFRPPYPAVSGLWGKPTLINNVETLSTIPWIIRNSADTLAQLGTSGSKGTKVFALAGKIARGGLIEVPMGVTIGQIVNDIGGGVAGGKKFKAVQIGGPSGGCVPASLSGTPVDYEALTAAGAIMGSGGMVVLDEDDCMVDIARYFLRFTQNQSCGKCTCCRIGTRLMLDILDRLSEGQASKEDVEKLEELALAVRAGSLCGLGKTAPNPVLSTLKFFRDEYDAHLAGRCPAGVCKGLVHYRITDDCIGCTICAQNCPVDAIASKPYRKHSVDDQKCVRCGTCRIVCPAKAVVRE